MDDFIYESADLAILDDYADDEIDAIDDLIDGTDMEAEDQLIGDAIVDCENDNTDYEQYLGKDDE